MTSTPTTSAPALKVDQDDGIDLGHLGLLVILCIPWLISLNAPFVLIDDPVYITNNPPIAQGLTADSIRWAFTTLEPSYWQPLTWLSFLVNVTIFGPTSAGFHIVNVALHVANVLLAYLLVERMTRSPGRSLLVAALFAIHPLRVESVAWATERKDVLSVFFALLTLLAYLHYARKRRIGAYLAAIGFFILALMTKPMVVTLPFMMLLLDYWPLNRLRLGREPEGAKGTGLGRLVLEKVPFFVMATGSAVLTASIVAHASKAGTLDVFPLLLRLQNALVCLALCFRDTFYFLGLSVFYPQASMIPVWQVVLAGAVLLGIAGTLLAAYRKSPAHARPLIMGTLWFFGGLVPVLNVFQAGEQSRADRFSYLPSIGLMIALVWAWPEGWLASETGRKIRMGIASVVVLGLAAFTTHQLLLWKHPLDLYLDGLAHTSGNFRLETWAGSSYFQSGDFNKAIPHYQRAVEMHPQGIEYNNLGAAYVYDNQFAKAADCFERAHQLLPNQPEIEENYRRARERAGLRVP